MIVGSDVDSLNRSHRSDINIYDIYFDLFKGEDTISSKTALRLIPKCELI